MMNCSICQERMTQATNYDAIMGGVFTCPNGCRVCELCDRPAVEGSDNCLYHEWLDAVEDLRGEFSQAAQERVAKLRIRCEKAGIDVQNPTEAVA